MAFARVDAAEIAATLGFLERRLRGAAPPEIVARVRAIRAALVALAPRVRDAASPHVLVVVATAAFLDTPQAVDAYLALPPAVRAVAAIADRPSPARLLAERLARVDARLTAALDASYASDVGRLLANGRFLRARFGTAYDDFRQTAMSEPGNGMNVEEPSMRTDRA